MKLNRDWTVLLIGGASGSGKTCVSYPLARLYGVNLIEVDDLSLMLKAMTKPEHLPSVHYWDTHPGDDGVDATVSQLIDVSRELRPGLEAVIRNHLDSNIPVVMEGDFILPELSASLPDARVRSVFIHEPDRSRIIMNYLERESDGGLQNHRAEVSCCYGNWLANECSKLGIPVIESRPWESVLQRVIDCIS